MRPAHRLIAITVLVASGLAAAVLYWLAPTPRARDASRARVVAGERQHDSSVPRASDEQPHPRTDPPMPSQSALEQALRSTIAFQAQTIADLHEAAFGVPQPWPDDTPEKYREPIFESVVRDAIRKCGLDAETTTIDCEEPPCFATLSIPVSTIFSNSGLASLGRNCTAQPQAPIL